MKPLTRVPLREKALLVIEAITSDDLTEHLECKLLRRRPFTTEESEAMAKKLMRIYGISHSSNKRHTCYSVHNSERIQTNKMYRKFKSKRIL